MRYEHFLGSFTFFKDGNLGISKQGLGFLIVINDHVIIALEETETSAIYYSTKILFNFATMQTSIIRSYCILYSRPVDTAYIVQVQLHLLDVALDVEWQVEEEFETLQYIEGVACRVGFILSAQNLLKQSVRGIACP